MSKAQYCDGCYKSKSREHEVWMSRHGHLSTIGPYHKVRLTREEKKGHSLYRWHYEAACGVNFHCEVDSSD